ncbi:hypothetical protein GGQ91_005291 [Methylobacterium fujisawaense]|uniref:Uncharacterized protein n=1 Tax=Methylobacterium fujisawaense TaxID=107400 RepID=A0ABR6DJ96_9HYPH|nr:hypothetical protein [Methylobacterium fujisawaense]
MPADTCVEPKPAKTKPAKTKPAKTKPVRCGADKRAPRKSVAGSSTPRAAGAREDEAGSASVPKRSATSGSLRELAYWSVMEKLARATMTSLPASS